MEDAKRIIETYTPHAYVIAFRLTGNRAEAWDLVQNAMLRVMRSIASYDPSYKVEQWLHRIIRNLYIDRLRKRARRREDPLERDADDGRLSPADTLADPSPTPEQVADREDRRGAVRRALGDLPVETRMAVVLVDLEGYTYEEAAKTLEIPISTLGVRVFRGRKILKERLRPFMEGKA